MVLVFSSVYVVDYVYRLVYVEPALHPWDVAYFIVMDELFDVLLNRFAGILLKIFASLFIMDIVLTFSFFFESLLGFGIRMVLVSKNDLRRIPSFWIIWNSFRRNYLYVW